MWSVLLLLLLMLLLVLLVMHSLLYISLQPVMASRLGLVRMVMAGALVMV